MIITNAPLKICGLQKPQWGQNVFEIWVWIFTPVNFMRNFGSAVEASAVAVYVYDFSFRVDAWEIWHQNQNYRKVVSSRLSQLVAQSRIFWHIMKGNFDVHLLRPLAKRVQNWIVDRSTARNFTVHDFYFFSQLTCKVGEFTLVKCMFEVIIDFLRLLKFVSFV